MSDRFYHRFEKLVHLPEPEGTGLSPDLEWMIQSNQAHESMIVEVLVFEYHDHLYHLALSLLDDVQEAHRTVNETIYTVLNNKGKYWGKMDVSLWLCKLLIYICRRKLRWLGVKRAIAALFPRRFSPETCNVYPRTDEEIDLWVNFDSLPFRYRAPLILHVLHDLTAPQIAQILNLSGSKVHTRLEAALARLEALMQRRGYASGDVKANLAQSLERRWIRERKTRADLAGVYADINRNTADHSQSQQLMLLIKKSALMLMVIFFIGLGSFVVQRVVPEPIQRSLGIPSLRDSVGSESAFFREGIETGEISRELPDMPKPLTVQSSLDEIRERMRESERYWNSIFLDLQIIQYGIPGYVGPPKIYRNQIWLSESNKVVLSGRAGGDPDYWLNERRDKVSGANLKSGSLQLYSQEGLKVLLPGLAPLELYYADKPAIDGVREGAYASMMVFPDILADDHRDMQVLGGDSILGRQVLLLRIGSLDKGHSRVWVDARSGIIMHWQQLGEEDPKTVSEEAIINAIEFNAPLQKLSHASTSEGRQEWVQTWRQSLSKDPVPTPKWTPPQGRSIKRLKITAPQEMDFSGSRINFQWQPEIDTGLELEEMTPSDRAEIFAKGYFLGEVEMGNPWNILCKRSNGGQLIAFLEPSQGSEGSFYAANSLRWIDLSNPRTRTVGADFIRTSVDFAFAPDSQRIAFWGCQTSYSSCGVYTYDFSSGRLDFLTSLSEAAVLFTWSSGGQYLAYVDGHLIFYIMRVSNGSHIYTRPLNWQDLGLPEDVPMRNWDGNFPPQRTGLEGCVNPPETMGKR